MVQLTYNDERTRLFPGMITRGRSAKHAETRVNAQAGQPQIVDIVFSLTWANDDDVSTSIAGTAVDTIDQQGATPEAARDNHLADLQADSASAEYGTWEAVDTDTIRWTSREITEGLGNYYSVPIVTTPTTAGDGDAVATETQARISAQHLRFGVGVVHDPNTPDPAGKRVVLPSATGQRFAGVAVHSHAVDNRNLQGDDGIPLNNPFSAAMQDHVAVRVDADVAAAITPGLPAFLRHTANGNGVPGQFRHNADSATADAVAAVFTGVVQGTGEGAIAELHVNAP